MYENEELEDWPTSQPTTPSRRSLHDQDDDDDDDFLAPDEPSQGFATHTSFDAYFQQTSKASRTSSNVFSALVSPLTPEEYAEVLKKLQSDPREHERPLWRDPQSRRMCFQRYKMEMEEGYNLMLYGLGSKREFLNAFANDLARTGGHVVVANGFQPGFTFKDLLGAIEGIPGVFDGSSSSPQDTGGSAEAQMRRIYAFFSHSDSPRLFLIVHNIEGAAFRNVKNRAALALLALAPNIHLVASVDHVAGTQRWSLSELFARKPKSQSPSSSGTVQDSGITPGRGFAWLWHDLTTLAAYDFELAYADPTSLSGAAALRGARTPAAAIALAGAQNALVTETAARHVIASVTQKAKKLFVLLGYKQLGVMEAGGEKEKEGGGGVGETERAFDYDRLFAVARDNFVATNDTALRALLGEFRDHGLVVTMTSQGGESLWIPMRREALLKIVGELKAEGH